MSRPQKELATQSCHDFYALTSAVNIYDSIHENNWEETSYMVFHRHSPVIHENLNCALKCNYRDSVTIHVVGSVSNVVYYQCVWRIFYIDHYAKTVRQFMDKITVTPSAVTDT